MHVVIIITGIKEQVSKERYILSKRFLAFIARKSSFDISLLKLTYFLFPTAIFLSFCKHSFETSVVLKVSHLVSHCNSFLSSASILLKLALF